MDLESRMKLHLLVYKIVSLRIVCGGYEDSATVRNKLEAEIRVRMGRVSDLERRTELDAAQRLFEMYEEKAKSLAEAASLKFMRRPESSRITLHV